MTDKKRELRVWWNRHENDLHVMPGGPDGGMTLTVLCHNPVHGPSMMTGDPAWPPFIKELERRGYDITTFKLSVQRREEHAWVKRDAILYPQDGRGKPAKVDWIQWRGKQVTVFFALPSKRRPTEPEWEVPFSAVFAGEDPHMSLDEVERRYQPAPATPHEWTHNDLPPMFGLVQGVQANRA